MYNYVDIDNIMFVNIVVVGIIWQTLQPLKDIYFVFLNFIQY